MSKVVLHITQSLDGYIARKNGDDSWLNDYQDEDYGYDGFLESIHALVIGANTFRRAQTLQEWPYGKIATYVISHYEIGSLPHPEVHCYGESLSVLVRGLKKMSQKHVWLVGGAQLITTFLDQKLVDEMQLFVLPVLLREGIPLFHRAREELRLSLLRTTTYANGVLQMHYAWKH